jgi:hypothetical protein
MPSQTPIHLREGEKPNAKKGGKGFIPPAQSQFRLLPPLLTSQTMKEVRYQELRARRRSSTVGCVKYNEYVICKKQYVKGGFCRTGWV